MLSSQNSDGNCKSENARIEKKFSFTGKLNGFGKIDKLPNFRYRWNSNEEVFTILTSFQEHKKWVLNEVKIRPPNGSQLLYNKANFKTRVYHNDKYFWKTRKNSKSSRVDHSSLRIKGIECIYCSYVHSALVPTFHRRCYWLLENPDIVLVHYLNLPDGSTTHGHLVNSLLPFRKMHEQELMDQLQPILTNSGHKEDNNQKIANVDIDKLISEVKSYKEPKTNESICQNNTLDAGEPRVTSVKLRNSIPSRTVGPTSYASEKCCNCNQNLVAKIPVDSSRLNTNVAVTINKQNTPFADNLQCVKASVSDDRRTQKAPNCRDNFAPTKGSSKPNTADQSHRTVGSCREQLIRSEPKDPNESLINSTVFVNGRHELAEQRPITSKQDPFRINHALVGLGYDGLDLVENNPSEGDVTKELDMTLFDNDLLDYLPDYLIDMNGLPSEGRESDGLDVVSRTCSLSRDQCCSSVIPKTTSNHITFPSSLSTDIISSSTSSICSDGYRRGHQLHQNMVRNNTVGVNIQRSSSPFTDVISTHCHTFSHLDSSPSDTSYEGLAPAIRHTMTSAVNSRQCPSFTSPQTFACSDVDSAKRITPAITISPLRSQTLTASDTLVHRYNNVNTDCTKPCDTEYQINTPPLPESEGPLTESLDTITEFSPEWSYCEGKTKVLILGRWTHLDGSYTCLFGGCIVPGTLIQSGVLRCFCPPHEAGLVALQVAWNGFIVSNACVFEYKARDKPVSPVQEWLRISEVELKKLIVEKMERLEATFVVGGDSEAINSVCSLSDSLEERIMKICEMLFERAPTNTSTHEEVGSKGLSLLHLAAALGFTKLIKLLRQNTVSQFEQRSGNRTNNGDVMTPVIGWTPLSKDTCGCSPLMWACWRGHTDSALALLAWEPSSYDNCDNTGRSPKLMAEEMGHEDLARKMEEFISCKNNDSFVLDSSLSLPSPSSSCAYLSVSSNERQLECPPSEHSLMLERVDGSSEDSVDLEMVSVTSEDRPNTLGKILVEVRTLIQEAEERARSTQSPFQSSNVSTPFGVAFTRFSDIKYQDKDPKEELSTEARLNPRNLHCDTFSVDSNSPVQTPSTLSPGSPAFRSSPQSSGTDTSEFEEFLNKPRKFLEKDFSELTLTDTEQQELLHAAKVIQNAYRQFKIRKRQHVDELKAAVLIQSYYRRYKQFALYKRITKAALLIQNSYRAHREHEQFKKSRHAAAVIQNCFRHYRKRKQRHAEEDAPGKRLGTKYLKPSNDR